MARITNTKIVHQDGAVQWVMERTVGNVVHQHNVYFSVQMLNLREFCAYRLLEARKELYTKIHHGVDIKPKVSAPIIRSMKADMMRMNYL